MIKRGDWVWACVGRKGSKYKVFRVVGEGLWLELPGCTVISYKSMDEVWKAKPPLIAIIRTWLQCGFANK